MKSLSRCFSFRFPVPGLLHSSLLLPLLDRTRPGEDGPDEIAEVVHPKHHARIQRQARHHDLIPRGLGPGFGPEEVDGGDLGEADPVGGELGHGHLALVEADEVPALEVAAARPAHRRRGALWGGGVRVREVRVFGRPAL